MSEIAPTLIQPILGVTAALFSIWVGQAFSLVGSALTQFVLVWWITVLQIAT